MHNDDDFQRDATDGKLQRVVDAVQANPNTYAKYAAAPATADALAKLQRFHTLVKANGGATVSIHQLLRKGDDKTTAVRVGHDRRCGPAAPCKTTVTMMSRKRSSCALLNTLFLTPSESLPVSSDHDGTRICSIVR